VPQITTQAETYTIPLAVLPISVAPTGWSMADSNLKLPYPKAAKAALSSAVLTSM
jgi:hypothetical protein